MRAYWTFASMAMTVAASPWRLNRPRSRVPNWATARAGVRRANRSVRGSTASPPSRSRKRPLPEADVQGLGDGPPAPPGGRLPLQVDLDHRQRARHERVVRVIHL